MPRSLTIHPASLALGLVLASVCFLSMGQTTITPTPLGSTVRVEYMPHPRDMVQVRGTVPYVVPQDKVFVLTGLGNANGLPYGALLKVDGVQEDLMTLYGGGGGGFWGSTSILAVPTGFTVRGGSTIEVCANFGPTICQEASARAWGYLAPQ